VAVDSRPPAREHMSDSDISVMVSAESGQYSSEEQEQRTTQKHNENSSEWCQWQPADTLMHYFEHCELNC